LNPSWSSSMPFAHSTGAGGGTGPSFGTKVIWPSPACVPTLPDAPVTSAVFAEA
jgi:hypothetical protein